LWTLPDKVRGEWSLMALCYNFFRVLSILGMDRFLAYLAKNYPRVVAWWLKHLHAFIDRRLVNAAHIVAQSTSVRLELSSAA
jgi:hypothetical protein